jgi:hypothetical protein
MNYPPAIGKHTCRITRFDHPRMAVRLERLPTSGRTIDPHQRSSAAKKLTAA